MKVTKKDFGVNIDNMPKEQKEFMDNMLGLMCDVVNKSAEGTMSKEDVEEAFKGINEKLKSYDGAKFDSLVKDNEELVKQVKSLNESIEKLKSKGFGVEAINKFDDALNRMFESEKFQEFVEGHARKSGSFEGFSLKEAMSLTGSYDGDILITQQQNRVVSPFNNKRLHMRDVINTLQGDPAYPSLSYAQIETMDKNARFVSENGELPQSSFTVKEKQVQTTRLGTHARISKRMLKSRVFVRSYILNTLPEAVLNAEDWNILFGDGNGENLLGIVNNPGVKAVETIIATSVVEGSAGSVTAVESYNGGKDTLITFAKPYGEILDGMTITFTGATNHADLAVANELVKVNDTQILLVGVPYVEETTIAKLTFAVNYAGFKSVEDPNSEDVIKTAIAVMTYAQYTPNAIILNPMTVNAIETEKDTTGRNLGIVKNANGYKTIAGIPVIEYSGIMPGKYLVGDFTNGANLVDYTSLSLEWADDVDSKLKNQVVLIAQEEVILPVYNPWSFAYGSLASLKSAITKA